MNPKQEQFLSVLEAHKKLIYKVSHTYSRDWEEFQDLVQEIISQLWMAYPKYDESYKFSTWMYRIALNTAISFFRKEIRHKETFGELGDQLLRIADDPYDDPYDQPLALLRRLINRMDRMNKALMLLYLEDKSYQEIADILGISVTNVGSKLNRIRQQLKKQFETQKNL
jgi:RNA polymerase sigma-70 factor (ECF subfamily)